MFRKTSAIIFSLTFVVSVLAVVEVQAEMVFYLPFDEASGVPEDRSDSPTDVSIRGELDWGEGKFGGAMEFDGGSDNFLEADNAAKLEGMKALTIMVWVKADTPDSKARGIVSKRKASADADLYNLFSYTGIKFCGRVDGWKLNQGDLQTFSTTIIEDRTWYHVVYVFDGDADEAERQKMYIDGVLEATKSHPDDAILVGGSSLYIGTLNEGYAQNWQGALDELSIWDEAIPEEEIQKFLQVPVSEVMAVQPQRKLPLTWGSIKRNME